MPRAPRDTDAGVFHVHAHSVWSAQLFVDDLDRLRFLRELAFAIEAAGWTCIAYCVMTSHYHLILDVEDRALPTGMHTLNFRYAAGFNARHAARGHVLGQRYKAHRLHDDAYLLSAYRYVARNPVEAGICDTPQSWPWSSYAGTIGLREATSFVDASLVLDLFSPDGELAAARLRRFVEEP